MCLASKAGFKDFSHGGVTRAMRSCGQSTFQHQLCCFVATSNFEASWSSWSNLAERRLSLTQKITQISVCHREREPERPTRTRARNLIWNRTRFMAEIKVHHVQFCVCYFARRVLLPSLSPHPLLLAFMSSSLINADKFQLPIREIASPSIASLAPRTDGIN